MGFKNPFRTDAPEVHDLRISKKSPEDRIIALGGNPNVGKSTVFNSLTGLNQRTGNWPGKTVVNAQGRYRFQDQNFILVDIPGTYSLMANSAEEEVARDFICFGNPDVTVVVADATCLERNLNLVMQVMEITDRVVLCVNLMDEARKKAHPHRPYKAVRGAWDSGSRDQRPQRQGAARADGGGKRGRGRRTGASPIARGLR